MDINDFVETIKTKEDFLTFLKLLQTDFNTEKEPWDNRDLESYLSGMEGFVEDLDGYQLNFPSFSQNPSWKLFAQILIAATIYE